MTQEPTPPAPTPPSTGHPVLTRRAVSSLALAVGASGLVLAACGGGDSTTTADASAGAPSGTPSNTPSPTATTSSPTPSPSASAPASAAAPPQGGGQPPTQHQPATQPPPQAPPPQQQPAPPPTTAKPAGTRLASVSDVPAGGGVVLSGQNIVLTNTGGTIHGFSSTCTHQGCTVGGVSGGTINCPCHGSRFDAASGAVAAGPAQRALPAVRVVVQDGVVYKP
jgi:Rieske Fe-S protein